MDRIDERNFKEKLQNSIIKRWRVKFIDPKLEPETALDTETSEAQEAGDDENRLAMEIYERLQKEAKEDEDAKLAEQLEAYEQQAWMERTGATSLYGQNPIEDDETREQVEQILSEKKNQVQDIIENHEKEQEQIGQILSEKDENLQKIIKENVK